MAVKRIEYMCSHCGKKKLVLFQWADLSPANVREKTEINRTLGLLIASLKIEFMEMILWDL